MSKAINIKWETDGEKVDLPSEVNLPDYLLKGDYDIADYLSEKYGWLINSLEIMTDETIKQRLAYLKKQIQAENISQGEIIELQGLKDHIDKNDTPLLQWAGVEEFEEYYYIDFKTKTICSWQNEGSDIDKANKLIGNYFKTLLVAKNFLKDIN